MNKKFLLINLLFLVILSLSVSATLPPLTSVNLSYSLDTADYSGTNVFDVAHFIHNASKGTSVTIGGTGVINQMGTFPGGGDSYMLLGNSAAVQMASDVSSCNMFWIQITGTGDAGRIYQTNFGADERGIWLGTDWYMRWTGSNDKPILSGGERVMGAFTHYAWCVGPPYALLWENGTIKFNGTNYVNTAVDDTYWGTREGADRSIQALFDEIHFFNPGYRLTTAEVVGVYEAEKAGYSFQDGWSSGSTSPIMVNTFILPYYPGTNNDLYGMCIATDVDNSTESPTYHYSWYRDGIINITGSNATGSFGDTAVVNILPSYKTKQYEEWNFTCNVTDGSTFSNNTLSYSVTINNTPPTITQSTLTPLVADENDDIIGWCNATDYNDVSYNVKWYINGNNVLNYTSPFYSPNILTNITNLSSSYTTVADEIIFSCQANDSVDVSDWLNSSVLDIRSPPATITNLGDNSNYFFPEVGDSITLNGTVTQFYGVDTCELYIRTTDTKPFVLSDSTYVGVNLSNVELFYTVTYLNNKTNPNVSWFMRCNDTFNSYTNSTIQNFTVVDETFPYIPPPGQGNFFSNDNLSIISSFLYNGSLNVTFVDQNLFQAFINITCDVSGQIYYWESLDINTSIYNLVDEVDMTGLPLQHCSVLLGASDDHTKEEIGKYKTKEIDLGYSYVTKENNDIKITAVTDKKNIKDLKTKKEKDRYTFNFEFKDKQLEREFIIDTNNKIYPRDNSLYPGHVVVWNSNTKTGNWIDLADNETKEDNTLESFTERISDTQVKIKIRTKIPDKEIVYKSNKKNNKLTTDNIQNFNELLEKYGKSYYEFHSIGGTNVVNVTYGFFIGGAIHINTTNLYDNTEIDNVSCDITTISGYPLISETQTINGGSGYLSNITNGSYSLDCYNNKFFNKQFVVDVNEGLGLSNISYISYQSVFTIITRNIKNLVLLDNVNISVSSVTKTVNYSESTTTPITFYGNSSYYNITAIRTDYNDLTKQTFVNYRENKTVYMDMGFNATFFFYDELTLLPFNMSGPDKILFLLMCPDETIQTELTNATSQSIPITCNYDKFRISLFYGTQDYYRTYILSTTESLNYSIYLIDLYTTTSIFNSFQLDDLLDEYENPSIYLKKIINSEETQITADFIDIENKIGAYLIQNHEYIVEVHSDNKPIRVMGSYSATSEGEKTLSLYNINLNPSPSGYINSVTYAIEAVNTTEGDLFINAYYEDTENLTNSVTFVVYKDVWNGTIIFQSIIPGNTTIEITYNATANKNDILFAGFLVSHSVAGNFALGSLVNDIQTISLGIEKYLKTGFMDWFIALLLGALAIMATIKSGNLVALAIVGMGALFIIFGWFGLAKGVLALAAIISLVSFLKERGKEP